MTYEYIRNHPEVRDVLLSGGDAFMQSDEMLEYVISSLRQIPHVEIIRIGSRTPVVMPQRITPELCQMLGVLLDNAIEAANEAAERNVALEMRNIDGGLEVIVRNSYAGQVQPQLLTHGGNSTKEGHSGQGLASCYRILARKRNAHLNFWVTGQHVQAQLLLNR